MIQARILTKRWVDAGGRGQRTDASPIITLHLLRVTVSGLIRARYLPFRITAAASISL